MHKLTNRRKVFQLNQLGFNRCLDFGYYHYNAVEPVLEIHSHREVLEICYCLKGQQYYEVEGDLFKLTGNCIFIVPPNLEHSSGVYPEDIGELFWLQISLKKNEGELCNLSKEHTNFLLGELKKKGSALHKGSLNLKKILKNILINLEKPKSTIHDIHLNQLIIRLLLETLFLTKEPLNIVNSEKLKIIDKFINENLDKIIYVDELASLIDVSTAYFKFWFKQKKGIPPKAYINRMKIEQAKIDLLQKRTITQTAFELGFSSSQYFATIFKKHTGTTPKAYILLKKENKRTTAQIE